jgi:hypothetical protein
MVFLKQNWLVFSVFLPSIFTLWSCQSLEPNESTEQVSWISGKPTGTRQTYLLTPTGKKIFQASLDRYYVQPEHRAQPANCAINVSDVLKDADAKFGIYGSELIPAMEAQIASKKAQLNGKTYGASIFNTPHTESGFVAAINKNFKGGKIPTGTLVFGCLRSDCSGQAGDGHIGIVGDLDEQGNLQIYHNNWYRPENNNGIWAKYMVSKDHLNRGFKRQWMPTPWLNLSYAGDKLVGAKAVLPAIDDLDPFNYYTTFMVIPEIVGELDQGLVADGAVSERGSASGKRSGMTCEVRTDDPVGMNVRSTPNGDLLGTVASGTKFVWLADVGLWSRVQVRIAGKLFGAAGDGSEEAYIHSSGIFCP